MPGNVYDFKLFESNQLIWDYAIITEPAIPEYINMADLSPGMLKITLYLENLLKYFQKMCLNIFFFDWLFLKFSANQRKIIKPRTWKGPSINYVVSRGEGGGQKLPILLSKKTTKRGGRGSKIADFETT